MAGNVSSVVRRMICLTNSRKHSGRCIAGKELKGNGPGEWLRPVSTRPSQEISEEERRYQDGTMPKVLDISDVPLVKAVPEGHQPENVLIDADYYWVKRGRKSWADLASLIDEQASLWANGYSAYGKRNDRVPMDLLNAQLGSLRLIRLDRIRISVGPKAPEFDNPKRIVRASFTYRGTSYRLDVTDPAIERAYLGRADGEYEVGPAYVCVSLGEVYEGFAYKLVASILTRDMVP